MARVRDGVDEHPPQLLRDPLGRNGDDLAGHRADRNGGGRFDLEPEPRRQADGPKQPQLVLAESRRGIADGTQDAPLQVLAAPDVVDQPVRQGIQEHAVDREVAPRRIELGRAEHDRLGPTAVNVGPIAAKRGDLDLHAGVTRVPDAHDAERDADGNRPVGQDLHDLLGSRRGRHVVVGRRLAQDQVADAAAGPERLIASLHEPPNDSQGEIAIGLGVSHRGRPPIRG